MKVLFAVNNDNISDAILKKYQKEYKEIISYKNVYYFNAILKELQNNKNYDRIVISEDLEPFANNNFDTIDKFLFEKLDKISDEATKANGEDIEIILICTDRRSQSDEMLNKIFGIGIYNALIGDERNIDTLCKLLNQPRTKKEAKISYKIEGSSISYQAEDENNVSEAEVQNILAHYKRLGRDEDRYVDSFNNIVAQYTDAQLRIIIRYLPMNVKAVLEERSPKYQELATFSRTGKDGNPTIYKTKVSAEDKKNEKINVKMLRNEKDNITKPIVIPSALRSSKKIVEQKPVVEQKEEIKENLFEIEEQSDEKRGRGRPRKNPMPIEEEDKPKRGRGRPRKNSQEEEEDLDLFGLDEIDNNQEDTAETSLDDINLFDLDEQPNETNNAQEEDLDLFSLDDIEQEKEEDNESILDDQNQEQEIDLFNIEDEKEEAPEVDMFNIEEEDTKLEEAPEVDMFNIEEEGEEEKEELPEEDMFMPQENTEEPHEIEPKEKPMSSELNTVLTGERKVVTFVGTTKNGTSFIVNNLALLLSSLNIKTAVLDVTANNNAYYIFTNNEQRLRDLAENSIEDLNRGITNGIPVNKNLDVYTQLPGKQMNGIEVDNVLTTLAQKYNVILIDADFNTSSEYFDRSQEIYLIQSMDILTIQPLTAFLRNLKSKNILKPEKLKVVINKAEKVKSLSDKTLIGGISSYNDPAMSYMTELFDKEKMVYCKIPFETQNYVKYLDSLVNCDITLNGYTKQFMNALNELASMVYPLLNRQTYSPLGNNKKKMEFSDSTKSILNKMKKNY